MLLTDIKEHIANIIFCDKLFIIHIISLNRNVTLNKKGINENNYDLIVKCSIKYCNIAVFYAVFFKQLINAIYFTALHLGYCQRDAAY